MDQAVSSVLKEGMPVNKASKIFNVPRKILTERVGGRVRQSTKPPRCTTSLVNSSERERERKRENERGWGVVGGRVNGSTRPPKSSTSLVKPLPRKWGAGISTS